MLGREFDNRWFHDFTPYFPGLDHLAQHEIFSPQYAGVKKIVFLGASAVDSIGCDSTWHKPDPNRDPPSNAHFSCTIAAHLNDELRAAGLGGEWRAFSLARNGTKLTPMLYVLAQLSAIKPEIVVYGDTFDYYLWSNADADALNPRQYAALDQAFAASGATQEIWQAYRQNLVAHGWHPAVAGAAPPEVVGDPFESREATTLSDFMGAGGDWVARWLTHEGPPRPPEIRTIRRWRHAPDAKQPFVSPDPDYAYFQGFRLMELMQQAHGGKFLFYYSPQYDKRTDSNYRKGLKEFYGGYLQRHGIPFVSHVALNLRPDYETYDGNHQTTYGNRRIAEALFQDLRGQGWLPSSP